MKAVAHGKWVHFKHLKPGMTAGGLHVPETAKPTLVRGEVQSVGEDVKNIKAGDVIHVFPLDAFPGDAEGNYGTCDFATVLLVERSRAALPRAEDPHAEGAEGDA